MMISGGTNAMHCKLFMGTFSGTALDWFISLPDGHITSFDQFSALLKEPSSTRIPLLSLSISST